MYIYIYIYIYIYTYVFIYIHISLSIHIHLCIWSYHFFVLQEYGFKFHMNDLNATIGLANLPHAPRILEACRSNGT